MNTFSLELMSKRITFKKQKTNKNNLFLKQTKLKQHLQAQKTRRLQPSPRPRLRQRLEECEAQMRRSESASAQQSEELEKVKEVLAGVREGRGWNLISFFVNYYIYLFIFPSFWSLQEAFRCILCFIWLVFFCCRLADGFVFCWGWYFDVFCLFWSFGMKICFSFFAKRSLIFV